jgi:predicted RNase H-like HicB family nuclease
LKENYFMPLQLTVEIEREANGQFLAEVLELPGVAGRDDTREGAIVRAEALALRALAARLESGESVLNLADVFRISEAEPDASEIETAYLLKSETMKKRLLEAIARDGEGAVSLEEARARLGI